MLFTDIMQWLVNPLHNVGIACTKKLVIFSVHRIPSRERIKCKMKKTLKVAQIQCKRASLCKTDGRLNKNL